MTKISYSVKELLGFYENLKWVSDNIQISIPNATEISLKNFN